MTEITQKTSAENLQINGRKAHCAACLVEKYGKKKRTSIPHTCGNNNELIVPNDHATPHGLSGDQLFTGFQADTPTPKKRLVYIAGKVTGLPYFDVSLKFRNAQILLEMQGYHVLNPILLCTEDTPWPQAMRICMRALTTADAIFLLRDWEDSAGAKMEYDFATKVGMPVIKMP